MDWPEDVAAELPAPRDDEPASLRRDIADELSDHLRCALNRELHATADETQARQNVLSRFGDPRRIARRLWFDAMKERIMSQRITMIMSCTMAVVCLAALGLMWRLTLQNQQVNAQLLEALQSKQSPATELKSLEWNPVKVHLVLAKEGGEPAVGFQVGLGGNILGVSGEIRENEVEKTTGPDGTADLGLVRPGVYSLGVTTPWKERHERSITIHPGNWETIQIVCPPTPPEPVEIAVSVDWPDDLKQQGCWLVCSLSQHPRVFLGESWSAPFPFRYLEGETGAWNWRSRSVIISPTGQLFEGDSDSYLGFTPLMLKEGRLFDKSSEELLPHASLRRNGTDFVLDSKYAMVPRALPPGFGDNVDGIPESMRNRPAGGQWLKILCYDHVLRRSEFQAKPEQLSHWRFALPGDFAEQIRKKLGETGKG